MTSAFLTTENNMAAPTVFPPISSNWITHEFLYQCLSAISGECNYHISLTQSCGKKHNWFCDMHVHEGRRPCVFQYKMQLIFRKFLIYCHRYLSGVYCVHYFLLFVCLSLEKFELKIFMYICNYVEQHTSGRATDLIIHMWGQLKLANKQLWLVPI